MAQQRQTYYHRKFKKRFTEFNFIQEASHTLRGKILLKNFVFNICKIKYKWRVKNQKNILINQIRNIVKNNKVICALSGGVDSSVVAVLINKAIKKNLHCIMVDTGLMRKNEFKKVFNLLKYKHKLNIKLIDKSKLFVTKLKKISDPEKRENKEIFIKFEKSQRKSEMLSFWLKVHCTLILLRVSHLLVVKPR